MTQADFLKAAFPAATAIPVADLTGPRRFFNRELSWLAFNSRVLEEASNPIVPLLERLRFLTISATNLDEFYTVRVAGLRAQVRNGNAQASADGRTPSEQLTLIHAEARRLMQTQQSVYNKLKREMEAEKITLLTRSKLTTRDLKFLAENFIEKVFPVLSPLAIDPAHRCCRSRNKSPASSPCPANPAKPAFCHWKNCCSSISTCCFPAIPTVATASFASCATAILTSRRRPRIWCASLNPPSNAAAVAR